MKQLGTDKPTVQSSAFNSLGMANERLQQSLQFESQSASQRNQIAQTSLQAMQKQSSVSAESEIEIVQSEAIQEKNRQQARVSGGNGFLGGLAEAVGNYATTKLKIDAQDRELDVAEQQERNRQDAQLAEQRAAQAKAEQAALAEQRKSNYSEAFQKLSDFRVNFKNSKEWKDKSYGQYRREALKLVDGYDLDPDDVRALVGEVYSDLEQAIDSDVSKQAEYVEKVSTQATEQVTSEYMWKLTGALGDLRSSTYSKQVDGKTRFDEVLGELLSRDDLDDLQRSTIINAVYKEGLSSFQKGTEMYRQMEEQKGAIQQYSQEIVKANAAVRANQWSASQRDLYLAGKRQELKVPGEFADIDPFRDEQAAKDYLTLTNQISDLQNRGLIEASKGVQMSLQSVGYLVWRMKKDPRLINQLKTSSVYGQHPDIQTAIQTVEVYDKVVSDNQDLDRRRLLIQEEMTQLQQRGIEWFVRNSQTSKEISTAELLAIQAGLQVPGDATDPAVIAQQREAYQLAQTQLQNILVEKGRAIDVQMQQNIDKIRPYGLDVRNLDEVMPARYSSYQQEMNQWSQVVEAKKREQTATQGAQSSFNAGGGAGGNRPPLRVDAEGYLLDENGKRKTLSLNSYNIQGKKSVLPFRPNAPLSGVSSENYLETRGRRGGGTRKHAGEDIGVPAGTDIVSYIDGTVLFAGRSDEYGGYGNVIDILGDDGMVHRFAHLQNGGVNVRKGQRVSTGQQVGKSGDTGSPGSYHLHWEVRGDYTTGKASKFGSGGTVDPFDYTASQLFKSSAERQPRGNRQAWQTSNTENEKVMRIPKDALTLGDGVYYYNGKVGTINKPEEGLRPATGNVGTPLRMGTESNNRSTYKNDPSSNHGYAVLAQDKSFAREVSNVADRLNIPAQWLVDIMAFESTANFNASIAGGGNAQTGGRVVGLIQFTPETARRLGTSSAELAKMTRTQQLKYVEKYLSSPEFKPHLHKGIEYVLASIWGGGNMVAKMNKGEDVSNWGDGDIRFKNYLDKLGRDVGRKYETKYNRRERLVSTTHSGYHPGCKVCEQLRKSGTDILPHESQIG